MGGFFFGLRGRALLVVIGGGFGRPEVLGGVMVGEHERQGEAGGWW